MRILLVNNGDSPGAEANVRDWRRFVPEAVKKGGKFMAPLLPSSWQRFLIGGFGINERRFPIGLGYLSAVLKAEGGHEVELVDRFADPGIWIDDVGSFDFVGVYTSSPFFDDTLQILRRLEEDGYEGPIAAGGPHATTFPKTLPDRVDYVVQGEAEYVISDLVAGKYPSGSILRTSRIRDLDALPRCDYGLFLDRPRGYQLDFEFADRRPIYNLNTSRSCPFECTFCGVRDIWGRLWCAQSAERVLDDILFLKKDYGCRGVYFREDLFTGDHARVREICELLLRHEVDIVWACESRVSTGADRELVDLMARSGCRGFYIGAESGSQRMLDHYKKAIQLEDIYKTCEHASELGIAVYMSLIVAHPEETWTDKYATWKLVRDTKPAMYGLAPYRAEFARHGSVGYPEYGDREVIVEETSNSTWAGQKDRFAYLRADTPPIRKQKQPRRLEAEKKEARPPVAAGEGR